MAPNRRSIERTTAWLDAACHLRGAVRRARLTDVSANGCRAVVTFRGMIPGDRVVIRLTELLALPATVVWIDGEQSGLAFANPMVGAMLNQYMLRFGGTASLR